MRQDIINVKREPTTENEYGENVGELTDVISFGGFVTTMTQSERAKLGLEYSVNVVRVRTRYSPSISVITTRDFLEISDTLFSIISVENVGEDTKELLFIARFVS